MSAGQPFVVQLLNSTYGATGQIGFRAQFVKAELDRRSIENHVLARDFAVRAAGVKRVLPFGQIIPRMLNGYRMMLRPSFDNRTYDTKLFEYFVEPRFRRITPDGMERRLLVHFWEFSPKLFDCARSLGYQIIVDIPIAPSHEGVRLMMNGLATEIHVPAVNEREDYVIERADRLLAPSPYVADTLQRMGVEASRIAIVPFGTVLRPPGTRTRAPDEPLTFLFAGTLSRRKGLRFLLEAWKLGGFERDRLVLCGRVTRAARELLRQFATANVVTPGHVDIGPYLDTADVFVLPTLMEGSSKAVYEAMGASLPVITTPNSGTIAEHEREALLVPVGDIGALREAMQRLREDHALRRRLGEAAYEKVRHYTWERYAQGVVSAYESLYA